MPKFMDILSTPRASYIMHLSEIARFECDEILAKIDLFKRQKDFVKQARFQVEDIEGLEKIFLDLQDQINSVTSVSEIRIIRNKIEGMTLAHRHDFEEISMCFTMVRSMLDS